MIRVESSIKPSSFDSGPQKKGGWVIKLRTRDFVPVGEILERLGYRVEVRRDSLFEIAKGIFAEEGDFFLASRQWRERINAL